MMSGGSPKKLQNQDKSLIEVSRETLLKKFDLRLRQLLVCLSKVDISSMPSELVVHLKGLVQNPLKRDLTLMEQNRVHFNMHSGDIE